MSGVKIRKFLWLASRLLLAGVALFFLVRTISSHWTQLQSFEWAFRPLPLVGSVLLQLGAAIFWAAVWRHMVARSGYPMHWLQGVRVYFLSNLAKYVPGSIWGYVSRVYLGKSQDLTTMGVGISAVWEVGTTIIASLLLTATMIPVYPGQIPPIILRLVLAAALLCLIALMPPIFRRWVRVLDRWISIQRRPSFRWRDFFLYVASAFITHVMVGTAFFLFARSLTRVPLYAWWSFVGMWSFSATAGLVVILVPYGLGVREGLLMLFLQPFLPTESAALISLAARLWTLVGELLAAGFVTLLVLFSPRNGDNTP